MTTFGVDLAEWQALVVLAFLAVADWKDLRRTSYPSLTGAFVSFVISHLQRCDHPTRHCQQGISLNLAKTWVSSVYCIQLLWSSGERPLAGSAPTFLIFAGEADDVVAVRMEYLLPCVVPR